MDVPVPGSLGFEDVTRTVAVGPRQGVLLTTGGRGMVLCLAAYVYATVRTPEHDSNGGFALFLADSFTAAAFVPDVPFGS